MPHTVPACPQCGLENTYPDGSNYVCPDCTLEWPQVADAADADADAGDGVVRDANGNPLADGDAVILVKDLKVKGSSWSMAPMATTWTAKRTWAACCSSRSS